MPVIVVHAVVTVMGRKRQVDPGSLLVTQSTLIRDFQPSEKSVSKEVDFIPEGDNRGYPVALHTRAHAVAHTHAWRTWPCTF